MTNTSDGGRYEILHGRDASLETLAQVVALDAMSLDACYHVSAEDDHGLFRMNRENGLIVREKATGAVVGYSMLLPVTEETYAMIREGHFIDTHFRPDMVVGYDRPGIYFLYFASVVIHPEHRGVRMVVQMLDAMVEDFIGLAGRGIYVQKMLADVVSRDGEKFCRLFGLEEVCGTDHGSKIYEVSGLPPKMRVTTAATQRLFDAYNARFSVSR